MTTPKFDLYWTFPNPHERAVLVAIKNFRDEPLSPADRSKRAYFGSSDIEEIAAAMVRHEWTIESLVLTDGSGELLDDVRTRAYGAVLIDDLSKSALAASETLTKELRSVYVTAAVLTCGDEKMAFGRRSVFTSDPERFCAIVTGLTRLANRPRPVPVPKPFPYPALSPFWSRLLARTAGQPRS